MGADESLVESVFFGALEKDSTEQRDAYLEQACGGDSAVRQRVEKLLNAHPKLGSFLQGADDPAAVTTDQRIQEGPGATIGHYKLLQQIGEGGFGVVYMAQQEEPIRRRVALKIIKPGMDSKQVIARFEAERQALALMDHQNIARVFDAGTTDTGRPYFVMETVRGVPITDYCDRNKLTVQERLNLFMNVCNAVQHAHQKGIVHRDIKPSNVIVMLYDGRPEPKVIDFGVAKAIEHRLTDRTMFTAYGQMIGTLEYMSPEQAEMGGLDIDTRSDIYSLGVLLYELLTGSTPISREELNSAAFDEMLRTIREEEPPKPSVRLRQSDDSLPEVSAQRRMEPARLSRFVKGDLDWIVMKALEKDRTRRYETANGMAMDVKHYLSHEAVEACPPSAAYKLRKLIRKNRGLVGTATAFTGILLMATLVSAWLAIRFDEQRDMAVVAQLEAEAARDREEEAHEEAEQQRDAVEKAHQATQRLLHLTLIDRLAAEAKSLKTQSPSLSKLLAIEAVQSSQQYLNKILPSAYESLASSVDAVPGQLLTWQRPSCGSK